MKKLLVAGLLIYGGWWYASHRFNFDDTVRYIRKRPDASWAPAALYSVGMVYYQRDDYQKSQEIFTQLLTDYPTGQYTARTLLRLSEVAMENRDYETARQTLTRFLEEFPNNPDTLIAQKRFELARNR